MSASIIQARYDDLASIAARFGEQAEQSAALQQHVRQCADTLTQERWEGEGVLAFRTEMDDEVFPALQRLHDALKEAQAVTLDACGILQEAEEEAARLFLDDSVGQSGSPSVADAIAASEQAAEVVGETLNAFADLRAKARDTIGSLDALVAQSDRITIDVLESLFPEPEEGTRDTLFFNMQGSTKVHEFMSVNEAHTMSITRNPQPDGSYTYTLTIADKPGASISAFDGILGVSKASANATSFTFDPDKPGDMTRMLAIMGMGSVPAPWAAYLSIISPETPFLFQELISRQVQDGLPAYAENLTGIKVSDDIKGSLSAEQKEYLMNIAGVDASAQLGRSQEVRLNPSNNHWEQVSKYELSAELQQQFLMDKEGLHGNASLSIVRDLTDDSQKTHLTIEKISEDGDGVSVSDLKKYLPDAQLNALSVDSSTRDKVIIQYTFDQPLEDVRHIVLPEDGQLSFENLRNQATVDMKEIQVERESVGFENTFGKDNNMGINAGYQRERIISSTHTSDKIDDEIKQGAESIIP
jgi:WXG100 family type VII secretion target